MSDGKLLECVRCKERHSALDIAEGRYQLETLTCSRCYKEMQAMPHERSCFGKPTFILISGRRLYGYNPKAEECSSLCKDKKICRKLVWPV